MIILYIADLSGMNKLSPLVTPSGIAQSKSIPPSFDFFFLPFLPGEPLFPLLVDFFPLLSPDLSLGSFFASFFLSLALAA